MGTIDIDYGSLGIGLLLMLIPVYFLWHFKTGLLKPVLIGTVRMIIQLFLIGAYLRFLFEWNNSRSITKTTRITYLRYLSGFSLAVENFFPGIL